MTTGAQQKLVFGRDREVSAVEEAMERTKNGKGRLGALKSNPCIVAFGPGPEGATCGSCTHLFRQGGVAGNYLKCELRRITGGPATDHRSGWPACARFEARS